MAVMSEQDGAILRGAEATRQAREELTRRIGVVDSHVQSLAPRFLGESAAAFKKLMGDWNSESSRVSAALDEFEASLRAHQSHLDTGEDQQSAAFAKVAARLNGGM